MIEALKSILFGLCGITIIVVAMYLFGYLIEKIKKEFM